MKYMVIWTERSQGSLIEYENAQKHILEVFTQWNRAMMRSDSIGSYLRSCISGMHSERKVD